MKNVKLSQDELVHKINTETDFVNSQKYNHSLQTVLEKNPNGVTDRYAASLLAMSLDDFKALWEEIVNEYRQKLGIKLD